MAVRLRRLYLGCTKICVQQIALLRTDRANVEVLKSVAGCAVHRLATRQTQKQQKNQIHTILNEITVDYVCWWKLRVIRPRRKKLEVAYRILQLMFTARPAK